MREIEQPSNAYCFLVTLFKCASITSEGIPIQEGLLKGKRCMMPFKALAALQWRGSLGLGKGFRQVFRADQLCKDVLWWL